MNKETRQFIWGLLMIAMGIWTVYQPVLRHPNVYFIVTDWLDWASYVAGFYSLLIGTFYAGKTLR